MSDTLVCVHGFRMLLKFRTFSQKYKIYEIKSRTKFSAITVSHQSANRTRTHTHTHTHTHTRQRTHKLLVYQCTVMSWTSWRSIQKTSDIRCFVFSNLIIHFFFCVCVCIFITVLTKTCRTIAICFLDCHWGLSRKSFIHVSWKLSVLLRTHFLFALAIFLFSWFFFVVNHNYPDRGWDAPVKNYQRKQKIKTLSLPPSLRGYRACSFLLVCFNR